jgi:hypothetical protein
MKVQLFGVGTKSVSPAITAQRRINCFVDMRQQAEKTSLALIGRRGLTLLTSNISVNATRGMWAVNSLATPLLFVVQGMGLYSVNNASTVSFIGALTTNAGDVAMTDDGTNLLIVDGTHGYYYNMLVPAGLNVIVDGNFTTSPKYCTWMDTYFIVSSGLTNQFQLSTNSNPAVWPSVNINFTGSAGALQACLADHSILQLFGQDYTEFWQDTGSPDFPFAKIPGSSQEFGLISPWSLTKFDNTLVGLFRNRVGQINVGRMSGFGFQRISDQDIDALLNSYTNVADGRGYSFQTAGHQFYILNLPAAGTCWQFDGMSRVWSELQDTNGAAFWGDKGAFLVNNSVVNDRRNGNLYRLDGSVFTDNTSTIPAEIWSNHIWDDDKFIGISNVQIDMEQGTGTATGQGVNPVMDLQVSKDGGNSFFSVGYSTIGPIGQYTMRTRWNTLGAARDWVLKLRITDPVKRVITGASAEIIKARF